jgi:hypothetical protein
MVNSILQAAGVKYRKARFFPPPAGTYAVYTDDILTDGPDGLNLIKTHDVVVEVFEPEPDDATEAALEAAMDAARVRWQKQDRLWIQDVQRYQVVYEFTYTTKRRI